MFRNYCLTAIFSTVTLLWTTANAGLVTLDTESHSRFRVTNQCAETLWIQQNFVYKSNDPVVVRVPEGMSYDYTIPDEGLASTRFWAKSDCNEFGFQCGVGESVGVPEAEKQGIQHGPYAPDINSKFEATWGCMSSIFVNDPKRCAVNPSDPAKHLDALTWWNGSAVDGYTFPYAIRITHDELSCVHMRTGAPLHHPGVDCGGLRASSCPKDVDLSTEGKFNQINNHDMTHVNLQWMNEKTAQPAGCFSPCAKLTTSQGSDNGQTNGGWRVILGDLTPESNQAKMYCCPTPPVSPEACRVGPASKHEYTKSVHGAQQCNVYTYAYDDAEGLGVCGAQTHFELVFCPR